MQILMMIMSRCCDADEDNKIYCINLHKQQTILRPIIIVVLALHYALRERFIYLTESTTQITVCSCVFTVEIVDNKELSLSTSEYVWNDCRNLVSCNEMKFIKALRNKIDYLVEEDVVNIEDDEKVHFQYKFKFNIENERSLSRILVCVLVCPSSYVPTTLLQFEHMLLYLQPIQLAIRHLSCQWPARLNCFHFSDIFTLQRPHPFKISSHSASW